MTLARARIAAGMDHSALGSIIGPILDELAAAQPARFALGGFDVVATRPALGASQAYTVNQASNLQTVHVALRDVNAIQLLYINGHHETENVNTLAVTAQVSTGAAGAAPFNKVYFQGKRTVTLDIGGWALSDPVAVDLAAGATFHVHTYQDAGVGGTRIINHNAFLTGEFGNATVADQTGTQLSSGSSGGLCPNYIVAAQPPTTRVPMLGIYGDSIMDGKHDTNQEGYAARAVKGTYGYVGGALSSETLTSFLSSANSVKRRNRMAGITAGFCNYGINDVAVPRTLAQMRADVTSMAALMRRHGAQKVTWTTLLPLTTSSDTWATTANQTVSANEAGRVAFNDDLRANYRSYGVDYLFEAADVVEVNISDVATRNGGYWHPAYCTAPLGGGGSADGIHPSIAGHLALATSLQTFIAANPGMLGV